MQGAVPYRQHLESSTTRATVRAMHLQPGQLCRTKHLAMASSTLSPSARLPKAAAEAGSIITVSKPGVVSHDLRTDGSFPEWPAIQLAQGLRCCSIIAHFDRLELRIEPHAYGTSSQPAPGARKPPQLETSRVELAYGKESFLTVHFGPLYRAPSDLSRGASKYITQVLSRGVVINKQAYHFVGCSNSKLGQRSAVLYRCDSGDEAWNWLLSWGDFSKITSVAKLCKRTGLMFSAMSPIHLNSPAVPDAGSQATVTYLELDDIEAGGYCFTDGCGIISHRCAQRVMASLDKKMHVHSRRYLPSVYQIRFKGYKGVVHIDTPDGQFMAAAAEQSGLSNPSAVAGLDLLLRKSMRKVDKVQDPTFGLVDVSKPYKVGFLNEQFVMLLSALGVPDAELLAGQNEYFKELSQLTDDASVAIRYLLREEQFDAAEAVAGLPDQPNFPPAIAKQLHDILSREMRACIKEDQHGTNSNKSKRIITNTLAATASTTAEVAPRLDGPAQRARSPAATAPKQSSHPRGSYNIQGPSSSSSSSSSGSGSRFGMPPSPAAAAAAESDDSSAEDDVTDQLPRVKLRFRVPQSRLAFGIPDPTGLLQYGEAFFQPTVDGQPTVVKGCAVVARNPSYHPGDVRVLQLLDVPGLRRLKDVVVFPVNGPRPHADECSGGDYDGDKFFVCWDARFIPSKAALQPPLDYSALGGDAVAAHVDHTAFIKYFAEYDRSILGRLNTYYMYWAGLMGPNCPQCVELAYLFSRGVDSVKTGARTAIPAWLRPPRSDACPPPSTATNATAPGSSTSSGSHPSASPQASAACCSSSGNAVAAHASPHAPAARVWVQLQEQARCFVHSWYRQCGLTGGSSSSSSSSSATLTPSPESGGGVAAIACGLSLDDMLDLLDSRDVSASEFDLFRLARSWVQQHGPEAAGVDLMQLVDNLDFDKMTHEQRELVIAAGVPRDMVYNDITRSMLLSAHQTDKLGSIGQLRWRLYHAGDLSTETYWENIFTAATTHTKKLLLLQCHQPPQTIALYLPHQYPGEGVFPCATYRADGQTLSAITWAFGVDGFSSMQRLSGNCIDLDCQEKRIQIYRPRPLKPGEQPVLGDTTSRAASYLWLRRVRAPVTTQRAGPANRGGSRLPGQPQPKQRQYGQSSLKPNSPKQRTGLGRSSNTSSSRGDLTIALDQLLLSVDVQRFDRKFTHYTKTTKVAVTRYELYVVSCEPLDAPPLELPDTWEAFYSSNNNQSSSGSSSGGSCSLVAAVQPASPEEIAHATVLLQLLPGACTMMTPAIDDTKPQQEAPKPAAAAFGSHKVWPAAHTGATKELQQLHAWPALGRSVQVTSAAPANPNAARASSQGVINLRLSPPPPPRQQQQQQQQQQHQRQHSVRPEPELSSTAAATAVHELLVGWAEDNKLDAAVAMCAAVCGCQDPGVIAATEALWPRTWTALLSCSARLHQPDTAARLINLLLQQQIQQQKKLQQLQQQQQEQEQEFQQQNQPGHQLQHRPEKRILVSVFRNAVRLCSSTGMLQCCPSVVFAVWAFLQQHPEGGLLSSCSDGVTFELVLAAVRSAGTAPDLAGPVLQQLLACPSLNWSSNRLVEILEAVVMQCPDRTAAHLEVLPRVIAAASAGMHGKAAGVSSPAATTASAANLSLAQAAYSYQLHYSHALTTEFLQELCSSSTTAPAMLSAGMAGSGRTSSATHRLSSSAGQQQVFDYVHPVLLAAAKEKGGKPAWKAMARQLQVWPTSGLALGAGKHGCSIHNARAVKVSVNSTFAASAETEAGVPALLHDGEAQPAPVGAPTSCITQPQPPEVQQQELTGSRSDPQQITPEPASASDASSASTKLQVQVPCCVTFSVQSSVSVLQVGDLVLLSPQLLAPGDIGKPLYSIEGKVVELDISQMTVQLELPWQPMGLMEQMWQVQVLGNVVTYQRCLKGLANLVQQVLPLQPLAQGSSSAGLQSADAADRHVGEHMYPTDNSALLQIIVGSWYLQTDLGNGSISSTSMKEYQQQLLAAGEQPAGQEAVTHAVSDSQLRAVTAGKLNESQLAALKAAVQQRLTLIWGPPGTGKTHTIVQVLRVMLAQRQAGTRVRHPILVCAETHTAVDNIMTKLLAVSQQATDDALQVSKQQMLRIGEAGRVAPELKSCTLDALGGAVRNAAGYLDMKKVKPLLAGKLMVFATCAAAGASVLVAAAQAGVRFSTVIVDEATQVLEPCCLLPVMLGPAAQLVLVGDVKQLGPCVTPAAEEFDLQVSLFERLLEAGVARPHMLTVQYRMHPDIAALPSACFYDSKLHTHYKEQDCPMLPQPLQPGLTVIHVDGREQTSGCSKYNRHEVAVAIQLLKLLLDSNSSDSKNALGAAAADGSAGSSWIPVTLQGCDIGMITPYKAMVAELRQSVARVKGAAAVEINTVDAFQGREKAVIIFCAVRSNERADLGFVSNARRLNVAMTRAKHALVLIGNKEVLAEDEHWRLWVERGRHVEICQ